MKMRESILSISAGSFLSVLANIDGKTFIETIIVALIGGAVGYLGKLLVEWGLKQIRKILKIEHNEKS